LSSGVEKHPFNPSILTNPGSDGFGDR
jgi:hypothetical protein